MTCLLRIGWFDIRLRYGADAIYNSEDMSSIDEFSTANGSEDFKMGKGPLTKYIEMDFP